MIICLYQVKAVLDEIAEKLSEEFNMNELMGKVEEKTPYVVVALQECQRMNVLTKEIRRSLRELDLGLKVNSEFSYLPLFLFVTIPWLRDVIE